MLQNTKLYVLLSCICISVAAMQQDTAPIITEGTEDQIIALLKNGYDYTIPINYKIPDSDAQQSLSGIYIAIIRGQLKVIQYLHKQLGIDLYSACDSIFWPGWQPLHIAIYFNQLNIIRYYCSPEILQELKTRNIDINTPMPSGGMPGYAPIHTAAAVGSPEAIRLLHAAGADINALTKGPALEGIPALCLAILHNKVDNIKTLIALGAQLDGIALQCDKYVDIQTAFQHHQQYLQDIAPRTQQLILQCQRINAICTDTKKNIDAHQSQLAILYKSIYTCLSQGAEINIVDCNGLSPLHYCIQMHEPSMPTLADRCALALVRYGANPNIVDKKGLTPLGRACLHNNQRLISLLLRHGADPSQGIDAVSIAIATNNLVLRDQLFALATAASEQQSAPLQAQGPGMPAKRKRTSY